MNSLMNPDMPGMPSEAIAPASRKPAALDGRGPDPLI
ncbi:Uncharacterised protein [Mycobacteroides abscessus subsp. abscessus]|nr:Uncharacterised protein [Mycobacteroides abscessus subsp. abscessus]